MKLKNAFQYYFESWVELRKSYSRTLSDQSETESYILRSIEGKFAHVL